MRMDTQVRMMDNTNIAVSYNIASSVYRAKKKPSDIYTSDKEQITDEWRSKSYDIVKCGIVSETLRQHEKERSVVSHKQRCDIISKKLLYIIHER